MTRSQAVDGFRLAYDRVGSGRPAIVLLHGWPGDRTDYRAVVARLSEKRPSEKRPPEKRPSEKRLSEKRLPDFDVVVPDLRGFGESDKHPADPADQYSAAAQARSVVGLIEELRLDRPVLGGYDIGSRIAQAVAGSRPDLVRALVVTPPLPGAGQRVLAAAAQREYWYQAFHQLRLAEELIDGRPDAVRAYLRHFWSHWSGPDFEPAGDQLDHLVSHYGQPGAFTASIAWYRAGSGTVARSLAEQVPVPADLIRVPTTVLWPEHDPLFPRAWSDRLDEFFTDVTLRPVDGAGHFVPLERPGAFAAALADAVRKGATGKDATG